MSEDLPPIIPVFNTLDFNKDFFVSTTDGLTFNEAAKQFLKFPFAQGGETLQQTTINGVLTAKSTSNFNDILTMTSTDPAKREIKTSYLKLLDTGNDIYKNTIIVHNGTNTDIICVVFFGAINFRVFNNTGQQSVPVIIDAVNTTISNNLQANSSCTINGPLTVNSTSNLKENLLLNNGTDLNKRAIRSTFYYFYDTSNNPQATDPATIGSIYNENGTFYVVNSVAGGNFNVVLRDSLNAQYFPLQILPSGTTLRSSLGIAANFNLAMSGGTGSIQQARITGDLLSTNTLKKTNFAVNSGSSTGTFVATIEVIDSVNNKGLLINPNSANNVLGSSTIQFDSTIMTRYENEGAIGLTNWITAANNMKNYLRVFCTDGNNCGIVLQNGNSAGNFTEFKMSYDRSTLTQTTSFNNPVNFAPTTMNSNRRALNGLGYLNFLDISNNGLANFQNNGGRYNSSIWTNSYSAFDISNFGFGMMFDNEMPNGSYNFLTRNLLNQKLVSLQIKPDVISLYKTLRFNTGGASTDRDIIGVGSIVLTDTFGGGTSSSIQATTNTIEPISGMIYDCNINGGFHIFKCNDSAGTETAPVYYGSALSSFSNTLVVRNATTPSNRLDFTADAAQNFVLEAKTNTDNTIANLHIDCQERGTGGSLFGGRVATFNPSSLTIRRPLQFNYITVPTLNTQLGYVLSPTSIFDSSLSASASVQNVGNFSVPVTGTWMVQASVRLTGSANHSLTTFKAGISGVSGTLPALNSMYGMSLVGHQNISLSTTDTADFPMTSTIKIPSGGTTYVVLIINFSGGGTVNVKTSYALTRIG
jgi:hypothetical protein